MRKYRSPPGSPNTAWINITFLSLRWHRFQNKYSNLSLCPGPRSNSLWQTCNWKPISLKTAVPWNARRALESREQVTSRWPSIFPFSALILPFSSFSLSLSSHCCNNGPPAGNELKKKKNLPKNPTTIKTPYFHVKKCTPPSKTINSNSSVK